MSDYTVIHILYIIVSIYVYLRCIVIYVIYSSNVWFWFMYEMAVVRGNIYNIYIHTCILYANVYDINAYDIKRIICSTCT